MRCLRFRVPGESLSVRALVERADPTATPDAVQACIAAGRLRVAVIPAEGGSWQPGGAALRSADAGVAAGTALCLTESSEACALAAPFLEQSVDGPGKTREWRVLAETLPWPQGVLRGEGRAAPELAFERLQERDGVALFALRRDVPLASLRARMAAASAPILGDVLHGGRLIAGGLRVASGGSPLPAAFWPREPVFPTGEVELPVSAGTLRALRRGHPWILRDSETGDTGRGRAGGVVRVRGRRGREDGGLARVDGAGSLAARVWSSAGGRAHDVEARVDAALARRAGLLGRGARKTTAFRLVHGEADALPGLSVDRLGALLRVVVSSACGEAVRGAVVGCLLERLDTLLGPGTCVVTLAYQRKPPGGVVLRATGVWLDRGELEPDARPVVLEHGLRFSIDPGLGDPERPRPGIGLFLDQRENRRRVAGMVSGGRFLNLFAHTGAFSAALLRAGAEHVTSVDLSAPYLAWTERNLRLNDLEGERHHAVRGDARRHLAECPREARFAGIVLDPPTAAAAGRRFFSVKRDLLPMLEQALARLEPGGWLLVSRNDRARRGDLVEAVRRAARARGVRLGDVSRAPAGPDFPQLRGFPEGDPMQAVLARVR